MRTSPATAPRHRVPAAAALLLAVVALATGCVREPDATTCPAGVYCPAGSRCAARQAVCIFDDCGDGAIQAGEACDDGNLWDGDGCSSTCKSNETCGNTVVDEIKGEKCDDGNHVDGDKCSADCLSTEQCGNATVDFGEACDPGAVGTTSATCNSDCTPSRHGDGKVNPKDGEVCDGDGAGTGSGFSCQWAGCNFDCTLGRHGDGKVNQLDGEQCDRDGLAGEGPSCESPSCNSDCTWSRCGDGKPNAQDGEGCDDGNSSNLDDCLNTCEPSSCGDGYLYAGTQRTEACDLGNANAPDDPASCDYGQTTCDRCTTSCTRPGLLLSYCGDGVHQAAHEECDTQASHDCGACTGTCRVVTSSARATGTITVTSGPIDDGDSLTLADGRGDLVRLEFDVDGACTPISAGTSAVRCLDLFDPAGAPSVFDAEYLASTIRYAMRWDWAAWPLRVHPVDATSLNPVELDNDWRGVQGNVAAVTAGRTVTVAPAGGTIAIDGMGGGALCRDTRTCSLNSDCVSGRCENGRCSCTSNGQCISGHCSGGFCTCSDNSECFSNQCVNGSCCPTATPCR